MEAITPSSTQLFLQGIVVRVAWPPLLLLWMAFTKNACNPLAYATSPPAFIKSQNKLEKGKKSGVAYPKRHLKERSLTRSSRNLCDGCSWLCGWSLDFWVIVVALENNYKSGELPLISSVVRLNDDRVSRAQECVQSEGYK